MERVSIASSAIISVNKRSNDFFYDGYQSVILFVIFKGIYSSTNKRGKLKKGSVDSSHSRGNFSEISQKINRGGVQQKKSLSTKGRQPIILNHQQENTSRSNSSKSKFSEFSKEGTGYLIFIFNPLEAYSPFSKEKSAKRFL